MSHEADVAKIGRLHSVAMSGVGPCAELFSLFSSFDGACQSGSFLIQRNRDKRSTRTFGVGVFTQPESKADLTALKCDFRYSPDSRHRRPDRLCPKSARSRHVLLFDRKQKRDRSPQLPSWCAGRTYRVVITGNRCVQRLITHSENATETTADRHGPLLTRCRKPV